MEVAFDQNAAAELRASIRNFATLSTTLANAVRTHAGDLDTMSVELQSAVKSLNRTARQTERMAERVDSSVSSGELRKLMADLGAAAAELRITTTTLSGLSRELAGTQDRLDQFLLHGDSVLAKVNSGQGTLGKLLNDSSLYVGSDSLVFALRSLVTDIRANPKKFFSVRIF